MTEMSCASAREALADFVANRLGDDDAESVERHVEVCADCRAELDLTQMLYAGRPRVPAGLEARLVAAIRGDRAGARGHWWGLTAAAIVAIALGIGIVSEPTRPEADAEVPGFAYEVEEGTVWSSEDGLVAGAPSLDALSDEALRQLLDELTVGGAGGAA